MYSTFTAYILWLLSGFGALGFHRFYLGKFSTGLLWMATGGLFALGSICDFFTLPGQVREANIRNALYDQLRRHQPSPAGQTAQQNGWRYANDGEYRVMGTDSLTDSIKDRT